MKSSLKFMLKSLSSLFNCLGIFFAKADTKKRRYASAKASAFADCRGEFRTLFVNTNYFHNPLDTERKLNLHKMFRTYPERLLNVLFTFNYLLCSGRTICVKPLWRDMMENRHSSIHSFASSIHLFVPRLP